jgi:hypothetical protein
MSAEEIIIQAGGTARFIYSDELYALCSGRATVRRASHVEPTADGTWTADLTPVGGPLLGPFKTRRLALQAEVQWLRQHWLLAESDPASS